MASLRTLVAATSACLAVGALAAEWAFGPPELPFPAAHLVHREVFPSATLGRIVVGSAISDVYKRFGRSAVAVRNERSCVYFRYDPDFVDRATTLVFLVESGRIERKWLTHENESPPECTSVPGTVVDLTGYYDAGWCCTSWPARPATPWRTP
jgi:hypothetical protein